MDSGTSWGLIDVKDVDVIGLAGSALVECGTSLPVIQRRSDQMFCRFVVGSTPLQWFPASELEQLISEGRISPFDSPVPLPTTGGTPNAEQPAVIYLNQEFITQADVTLPVAIDGVPCTWIRLPKEAVATSATCLPRSSAEKLLNGWAEKLLTKLDKHLTIERSASSVEHLLHLADLGLCAATNKSLRWRLYLRYGASMAPDRVRRTFDSFIQREFPACQWDSYLSEMTDFQKVIASQAPAVGQSQLSPVASNAVDPNLVETVFREISEAQRKLKVLSPREKEILIYVSDGCTSKEISNLAGISGKIVEKHRARIMQKLELDSDAALCRLVSRAMLTSEILAAENYVPN